MFVFGPYTNQALAERRLGFRWPYRWGSIEGADDRSFVVFVDSEKVVATMDQLVVHGTFADTAGHPHGYPRDSARFVVRGSSGELRWTP